MFWKVVFSEDLLLIACKTKENDSIQACFIQQQHDISYLNSWIKYAFDFWFLKKDG